MQEVESLMAQREFNERFLASTYPYAVGPDSRDLRQIDVGVLSKFPIESFTNQVDDRKGGAEVKRRGIGDRAGSKTTAAQLLP